MRFFAFFFLAALVATTTAYVAEPKQTKGITDTIATVLCLERVVDDIKTNIATVTGTVGALQEVVAINEAKLGECKSIGGDNPSIIDQISQANCIINLAQSFRDDLLATINDIQNALNGLLNTVGAINECLA